MNQKSPTKKDKNGTNHTLHQNTAGSLSDGDKVTDIKKDKGKEFIPTDWTGERERLEKPSMQDDLQKGDSMEPLFLEEEEDDESFYLGSDDLGSESSQDSGDGSNEYQSENDLEEMEESEQKVEQQTEPVGSLENEVDELLKDIQEHASEYNQNDAGKERDFELVEPGTLRSGKRKRDFFGDLAQFPDFHDDLTIVGRGLPKSSGLQSKASGSNSLNP